MTELNWSHECRYHAWAICAHRLLLFLPPICSHLVGILTSHEFALRSEPLPLMIIAAKRDARKARSLDELEQLLDEEMDRKRLSREQMARVQAEGGEEDEDDDAVVLGVKGEKFRLRRHANCPVTWVGVSAKADQGLDAVRRFVVDPAIESQSWVQYLEPMDEPKKEK